jgi:serine/threonine-protein kinase
MTAGIGIVVSGGQKLMPVPIVVGKTQSEAEKALKDSGFKVTVSQGFSSTVAKGLVISQAPESGQKVPAETSVGIVVSEGAQNITVPGLSGQTLNQATTTLKSLGLGVEDVTNFSSTTKGQVEDQFPAAGSSVPPSTIVALIISGGSTTATGTVTVPNLKAMTATSAETAIKNLGLKWVSVQWSGTGLPLNEVYGQIPDSGALVPKNSSVIAIVSNGK